VVGGFCAGLGCALLFRWIDLKWSVAYRPQLAAIATMTAPSPLPVAPKTLEQIQRSSDEQIQP
jgi:hypothetical protein